MQTSRWIDNYMVSHIILIFWLVLTYWTIIFRRWGELDEFEGIIQHCSLSLWWTVVFNIKAQVLSFVNSFCRWNRSVTTLLVTCIEMSSQSPEFYLIQTAKTSYISLEKCYTKLISNFWAFGIEFTSFAFITSLVTMTKREAEKLWITYLNESLILPCQWFN